MSISIILVTHPEIIKTSAVIRKCHQEGLEFFILHTGQHYLYNMDRIFCEKLHLPETLFNPKIDSCSHGEQIEKILAKGAPHAVLVQGDTNTILAGATAASNRENGLFDRGK